MFCNYFGEYCFYKLLHIPSQNIIITNLWVRCRTEYFAGKISNTLSIFRYLENDRRSITYRPGLKHCKCNEFSSKLCAKEGATRRFYLPCKSSFTIASEESMSTRWDASSSLYAIVGWSVSPSVGSQDVIQTLKHRWPKVHCLANNAFLREEKCLK